MFPPTSMKAITAFSSRHHYHSEHQSELFDATWSSFASMKEKLVDICFHVFPRIVRDSYEFRKENMQQSYILDQFLKGQ